jgi:FkbM family methyltransferase
LKRNLLGFEDRYHLVDAAVSYEEGQLEFGIETTGRYGGIGAKTGTTITVSCLHINDVLEEVLEQAKTIDVLKIDTEGVEEKTVAAIDQHLARRIKTVLIEARPSTDLQPALFRQRQYGGVCRMSNKSLS